jgi:two-component system KDP operon response regulator KdpE
MSNLNEFILVVEDDPQIRNFVSYALQSEGYRVSAASTGRAALNLLLAEKVDLVLLDLGLPDIDGMEIIRTIREWSDLPIIVVSARDQDKEKVSALDGGADDYLTKPFSTTELLARVRVALRHLYKQSGLTTLSNLSVGSLAIDLKKRLVFLNQEELHVTPLEYSLLSLFFKNIGKVLTTNYIIKEIWGASYGSDTQALRALMAGLRRKIEENPARPRYIKTEIGVGYRLVDA